MRVRINDINFRQFINPIFKGRRLKTGLIPRDYKSHPVGSYSAASVTDIPLIPREEWPDRIKELERKKARNSDLRRTSNGGKPIPSLQQGDRGYCWTHSVTHGCMLRRAFSNSPYVALSAYSVACKIKNFRDQGGWGALALEFIEKNGIVPQELWPQEDSSRSLDTPKNWEAAKDYKATESWADLAEAVYDRDLTFDQHASLLLSGVPVVGDHNWWAHSILHLDLLEINPRKSLTDPNRWGTVIWNSWGDEWGELGEGILEGKKAVPDGGVAPLTMMGG